VPRKRPTYVEGGEGAPMEPPPNMMQAPSAPTGMPYGEHQASIQAQEAVPVAGGGAPGDLMSRIASLPPVDFNSVPNINDPTMEPAEPITTGLPVGPGLGPEVLGPAAAGRVESTLRLIADVSGNPEMRRLADIAALRGR
jgi:hypothetical protein